jgi:hypothetical protein
MVVMVAVFNSPSSFLKPNQQKKSEKRNYQTYQRKGREVNDVKKEKVLETALFWRQ